jgi:hypothetical protein
LGPGKTVVIASFMRKRDQLIWGTGGNSIPRQHPQKLVVRWVSVSDCSRHEHSGDREGRKKSTDGHG